MLVIGDPPDSAVSVHFDPNYSRDLPRAGAEMQENDSRLTIYLAECQTPGYAHARIDTEIAAIREAAGVSIGHEQSGVGADQFAESIPILVIEPFDVQPKDRCVLGC